MSELPAPGAYVCKCGDTFTIASDAVAAATSRVEAAERERDEARRAEALCEKHSERDRQDIQMIAQQRDAARAAVGRLEQERAELWAEIAQWKANFGESALRDAMKVLERLRAAEAAALK